MELKVPTISIIIGEGGSGGAIALASSNKVLMFENAIYSVISPEGCASILWRDPKKTLEAAEAMKLTSKDLLNLGIIDEIIIEPTGGAHRDKELSLSNVRLAIKKNLDELKSMTSDEIFSHRKNKFLSLGRKKGFISKTIEDENLIMKEDFIKKLIKEIEKYKYQIIFIFVLIFIGIFVYFL
tara:strand:- start:436 stop:981 length:546 start_codon:yes stop_codon:yes gene_type:complete